MDSLGGLKAPSLLVATISGRDPKWPFPQCLAEMIAMTRKFEIVRFTSKLNSSTDFGRCAKAREAIRLGFSHILFIDDDMGFPHDSADQLLSYRKPIIAANYTSRVAPIRPLAQRDKQNIHSKGRSGIERVDYAPTGLMMIETRVFGLLSFPWFKTEWLGPREDDWQTDDYYFCDKARAAGFEIWIDHDLSQATDHVGEHGFNHAMLIEPEPADPLEIARELRACALR